MSYVGKITAGGVSNAPIGSTLYGTCDTAGGTAAKVVTCADFDKLLTGVTIHVKFTNSNTVASPTLNVNSTGAKNIYKYGTTAPGTTAATSWQAGSVVSFTYDGSYWQMNDHLDDTNTQSVTSVAGKTGAVTLSASDVGALASSTKYAGASTAGGSATSAAKLDTTTAGSATQPCYFSSGVPSACTYSLNKTVPSDAVFTDTNNAVAQTNSSTNADYRVLLSGTADDTERTEGIKKSGNLTYNPSTSALTLSGASSDVVLSGTNNYWYGTETSLKATISSAVTNISGLSTGKVDKTGDTMTGDLTVTTSAPSINSKTNAWTINTTSNNGLTATTNGGQFFTSGSDNQWIGRVLTQGDANGTTHLYLQAQNKKTDGTLVQNTISIDIAKDGTRSYQIANPANFRSAIGALATSGGTMTGDLHLQNSTIKMDATTIDLTKSNNGISSNANYYWSGLDNNGKNFTYICHTAKTDGSTSIVIASRAWNGSSTNYDNSLALNVNKSNTQTISVSSQSAWRTGIGAAAASSRLTKENVAPMTEDEAKKILDIDLISFQYKDAFIHPSETKHTCYGVIAEDVLDEIPYVVNVPEGYDESEFDESLGFEQKVLTIDYDKFVPYLLKVVQMQEARIQALENIIG